MGPSHRTQVRSQAGPGAGVAFSAVPTALSYSHCSALCCCDVSGSHCLFRCTLLCGRQIDKFGHHRASCARAGVLGRRGFALESGTARVCREAGGRVTTNVMVRDLELDDPQAAGTQVGNCRGWLPLLEGCQLVVDAISALHCDGPHTQNWWGLEDGPALLSWGSRLEVACPLKPHPS